MAGAGLSRRVGRGGGARRQEVPATIANLFAWWRADSGITIGTGVASWTSKVNGHVLSQGTAANQPAYTTSAALNNRPCLSFDGSNDDMQVTGAASLWNFMHNGNGGTIFTVNRHSATQNGAVCGTADGSGTGYGFQLRDLSSVSVPIGTYDEISNGAGVAAVGCSFAGAIPTYFAMRYSSAGGHKVRNSGTAWATGTAVTPSSNDASGALRIGRGVGGSTAYYTGAIAEVIVYNRYVTDSEAAAIHNYLISRYAL